MSSVARPRGLPGIIVGNALLYYDLLIFSVLAVQISQAIFPSGDPIINLMKTFSLVGIGYLARPLGAIVLGRLADRAGRRKALLIAFTIAGVAVIGQAMVPSYATAGLASPAAMVVFRLMLGFAMGGEVGAATALLVESAGERRRGFFVSLQLASQDVGQLLAGLVATSLALLATEAQLIDWGWRVAFLIGGSIVPFGLYLRSRLPETLASDTQEEDSRPQMKGRRHRSTLALAILLLAALFVANGIKYLGIYAQTVLGLQPKIAFSATISLSLAAIVFSMLGGRMSDILGRKLVMLCGLVFVTAAILPCFLLLNAWPGITSLLLASGLLAAGLAFSSGPIVTTLAELTPARRRATTVSVFVAFGVLLINTTGDVLLTWLLYASGEPLITAWAMTLVGGVGIVSCLMVPETGSRRRGGLFLPILGGRHSEPAAERAPETWPVSESESLRDLR